MEFLKSTVPEDFDGANVKSYLRYGLKLSMKLIKKVKWGGVFLDGKIINMRESVKAGQTIEIKFSQDESNIVPNAFPLDIVYEDDYILAVNKPINMPTHPSRGNSLPTLAEGVISYMKPPFVFRAINRLDRDTSGIVIIAKDAYSANLFAKLMRDGGFVKKYIAITDGIPKNEHGIIDAPIERESENSIKRMVRSDGKKAITEYRIIERNDKKALLEITLHTGRTHQIRVHMAYIGTPLYADFLYGNEIPGENYKLHAKSISFTHPITNKKTEITSPPHFTL